MVILHVCITPTLRVVYNDPCAQSFSIFNPLTNLEFNNIYLAADLNKINFLSNGNMQPGEKVYNLAIQTKIESMDAGDNTVCKCILYYCFNLLFAKEKHKISCFRCQIPGMKKISLISKKSHYASNETYTMHKRKTHRTANAKCIKQTILHITQMNTDRKTE